MHKIVKLSPNSFTEKDMIVVIRFLDNSKEIEEFLATLTSEKLLEYMFKVAHEYLEKNKEHSFKIRNKNIDYLDNDQHENKLKDKVIKEKLLYPRNKIKVENSIKNAQYNCEFNEKHKFFISRLTKRNYVEGHHLIPLEYQDEFEYTLDVEANIIFFYPVCHKKLHYSIFEEKYFG
ncbi:hypothetical protein [Tepidibacter sp. Z1-5]|uniref:hypothetical protein n=1 Tax=Tepidibacter sp. Z1-5 TaxID=3134138 RepID=UPI0030BA4164